MSVNYIIYIIGKISCNEPDTAFQVRWMVDGTKKINE